MRRSLACDKNHTLPEVTLGCVVELSVGTLSARSKTHGVLKMLGYESCIFEIRTNSLGFEMFSERGCNRHKVYSGVDGRPESNCK